MDGEAWNIKTFSILQYSESSFKYTCQYWISYNKCFIEVLFSEVFTSFFFSASIFFSCVHSLFFLPQQVILVRTFSVFLFWHFHRHFFSVNICNYWFSRFSNRSTLFIFKVVVTETVVWPKKDIGIPTECLKNFTLAGDFDDIYFRISSKFGNNMTNMNNMILVHL